MQPPSARRNIPYEQEEFEKFLDKEFDATLANEIPKSRPKPKRKMTLAEKVRNRRWKIVKGDKVFVLFAPDKGKISTILKILKVRRKCGCSFNARLF